MTAPDNDARATPDETPERSVLGLVAAVAVVCAYAIIDPILQELNVRGAADMAIEGSFLAAGTWPRSGSSSSRPSGATPRGNGR